MSKFLDEVRTALRSRHYAYRTEQSYVHWIVRFIRFHQLQHPNTLGPQAVTAFLSYLAMERAVAASTQNQARAALLFLYREVLQLPVEDFTDVVVAQKPKRLPTVRTKAEVAAVLAHLDGIYLLIARLLYGSGLRLLECLRLRVKDIDVTQLQLTIREGKGGVDRVTMLPKVLVKSLRPHLALVRQAHVDELRAGFGSVELPYALERKYPNACREWGWQ